MKYWNKDKKVRQQHWHKVTYGPKKRVQQSELGTVVYYDSPQPYQTHDALKVWCQRQSSSGRFYHYHASDTWWFEHEHDAIIFALKFCR